MNPSKRMGVNKFRSVKKFRRSAGRTKGANLGAVMRGGIRF